MKTVFLLICSLLTVFFNLNYTVSAEESTSIEDLPFSGYYITPEGHGITGLVFMDNQLRIYIDDTSHYSHGEFYHSHDHDHSHDEDHSHEDEHEHDDAHNHNESFPDQAFIESLFELNSFPHPDLSSYTDSVRDVYLEEGNLPYDLQSVYEEITTQITPDMSQSDIIELLNNHIPGIYYTEREGFNYFIVASPDVIQTDDGWTISLFGNELYYFTNDDYNLIDGNGVTYEYVDGVTPN